MMKNNDELQNALDQYPEGIRDVIGLFCRLWYFIPPSRSERTIKAWVNDAHDLAEAAGEFGGEALVEYREDFEDYMTTHGGQPPFWVTGPGSIVNVVRGKAAEMRMMKVSHD